MKTPEFERINLAPSLASAIDPHYEERRELDAPEVALPRPQPGVEERYRLIACRLEAILHRRHEPEHGTRPLGRVVIVTSAQRGDGRTTTTLHLGTALARALGRRVAVVDGDLARPGLAPMLGMGSGQGIVDVLERRASLDDVLLKGEDGGPLLVPAGSPDAGVRRRDITPILNTLREYHDIVLVDAPPIDTAADAAILGRNADGVVLVVRSGATREEQLATALDALVDTPLIGVVLNDHEGREGHERLRARARRVVQPTVWEEDD